MHKYQEFLEHTAPTQTESIQSYMIDDLKVWLKKASKRHPWWIYLPLQWFSKLLNMQILAPVPNYGGADAIHCEAKRIRELEAIGASVPKVLAESDTGLLIQDISYHDQQLMQLDHAFARTSDFQQRQNLFEAAIRALKQIHAKNNYLSEAFARNILIDSQQNISFIDFETDPRTTLDLEICQARDWLCLLFSTAFRFNEQERPVIEQLVREALKDRQDILLRLNKVGCRFAWLNSVGVERTGNDGKRMKIFLIFLKNLKPISS
ncbi:BUD32 family EKC/KEOPS complex subunit [Acinetobacter sp. ANC 4641]|uniref:hypothetical protein n=1 Tax=Acinetobacter sp. ANC 4641 TaxID=2529847 RepID=UPI00103B861E|nr:hypothetical protein [Acinetobacter sp. ANC 4641]TCB10727.1 hypothetical protein E0H78_09345 [Acinetobacter sp. ANC 4641]